MLQSKLGRAEPMLWVSAFSDEVFPSKMPMDIFGGRGHREVL